MEAKLSTIRPDMVAVPSAPRPTPTPSRVDFHEVLARGLVRGAEGAMRALPGAPMVALAVRGGVASAMTRPLSGSVGGGASLSAEGPAPIGGGGTGAAGSEGGIESSLQQSQEMNLYYLQIQEQVNAQNRSFSTISNVLKAEHDTVKTAIGNIR